MEILDFLDLAIKIENKISALYEMAAEKASGSKLELHSKLKTIAGEEIAHANVLRMGRNYAAEMPDLFSTQNINISEVQIQFEEAERSMSALAAENNLKSLMTYILDLEKRFERLHLATSLLIKDDSLKFLFVSLSKGDQNHIAMVTKILAGL